MKNSKAPNLTLEESQSQKKHKSHYTPAAYVQQRGKLIAEVINLTQTQYRKDKEMLSGVVGLTTSLEMAELDQVSIDFVEGMLGFMMWAGQTNQKTGPVLTTLIHDLGEFSRNRDENWFCPRTTGYQKYLSGASNVRV